MRNSEKTGCHGCRYSDWDADGCTCKLDGLLVGNPLCACKYLKAYGDKPITNGDMIRSMTNEEIAHYIDAVARCCRCGNCNDCPVNEAGEFCTENELVEYFGKEV